MEADEAAHYAVVVLKWTPYIAFSILIAKTLFTVIWRAWFHPLASIPGPRLAAVCGLWEAWQDIGRDGHLPRAVQELHRKYSMFIPVVVLHGLSLRHRHHSHFPRPRSRRRSRFLLPVESSTEGHEQQTAITKCTIGSSK